jgi:predicted anti-sigma-YlaC factor YlaD
MEELMLQALDGTISPADLARLNAHLNAHPDEREAFEQMARFEAEFGSAFMAEPVAAPAGLMTNVMTQVHQIAIAQPFAVTAMSGKQIALIILIFSSAMAAAFAICGGVLAYGSSVVQPDFGAASSMGRSIWVATQGVFRAAFSMTRAVLSQPLTWAVMAVGLLSILAWVRLIAPVWVPQRQLA